MATNDKPKTATTLLDKLRAGDLKAWDDLILLLGGELRAIAARAMRGERKGHTLEPTALVNEVWLKLRKREDVPWKSKSHFLAVAGIAMRCVLVDHAKGRRPRVEAEEKVAEEERRHHLKAMTVNFQDRLLAIDQLQVPMDRLEKRDRRAYEIVCARYFAGLGDGDIATLYGISVPTVERDLRFAKAFLFREIGKREKASG